jgi:ATP-dependent Clp protease ATP-binding subunit ClpC
VVVDCEGDPANVEKAKLTFRGADRGVQVPTRSPPTWGCVQAEE